MENNLLEVNLKEVKLICPICNRQIKMNINLDVLKKGTSGLVAFSTNHCNKIIIAHVDKNSNVRSVESAISTIESEKIQEQNVNEILEKVYPSLQNEATKEDYTFYFCNSNCLDGLKNVPNIVEKQMLRVIHSNKGVNLKTLKDRLKPVEEAYNMTFSYAQLENLLNKYLEMGYIIKEEF